MKYHFTAAYTDGHIEDFKFSQDSPDAAWAYAIGFSWEISRQNMVILSR